MARVAPIPAMDGGRSESSCAVKPGSLTAGRVEEQALPSLPRLTDDATQFLSGVVDIVSQQLNTAQLALTAHHNQVLQVIEAAHAELMVGTSSTGELRGRRLSGPPTAHDDGSKRAASLQIPFRHKVHPEGLRETASAPAPRAQVCCPTSSPQLLQLDTSTSSPPPTPVPSPSAGASPRGICSKLSVSSYASDDSDLLVRTTSPDPYAEPADVFFCGGGNRGLRASVRQNVIGHTVSRRQPSPEAKGHLAASSTGGASVFFEEMGDSMGFGRHTVFLDAETMKERVKQAIMKEEYNVYNLYATGGLCQWVARSHVFENMSLIVICCHAIYMAIDVDHNESTTFIGADPVYIIMENLFCFFYVSELMIRFCAFESKLKSLSDRWFVFDAIMSFMMVLETWVMTIFLAFLGTDFVDQGMESASLLKLLRLSRMTRLARLAKVLNATPELMILIKGVGVAARSVFFTLCLLALLIYVFAVGLKQVTEGSEPMHSIYFGTVLMSMNTLLLRGVLPDLADLVNAMGKAHPAFACIMLFFILFSSLTIMNMLVGVLVEVVSVVSAIEKEQMTIKYVKKMILGMLEDDFEDEDHNMMISKEEFKKLLLKPQACRIIQDVGVDVVGLVDFLDFIFQEGRELSFPEFMDVVLQLRGCNNATVRDVVDLRKFVLNQNNETVMAVTRSVRSVLAQHGLALQREVQYHNHVKTAPDPCGSHGVVSENLSNFGDDSQDVVPIEPQQRRIQFAEHISGSASDGNDSANGETRSEGTTASQLKERESLTYFTGPTISDCKVGESLNIPVCLLQPCAVPQEPHDKPLVHVSPPKDGAPAWATMRSPRQDERQSVDTTETMN